MLHPSVYGCQLPEGVVLLDVRNDKYLALSDPLLRKLSRVVQDWPDCAPRDCSGALTELAEPHVSDADLIVLCEQLTAHGILCRTGNQLRGPARQPVDLPHPTTFVPDYSGPTPNVGPLDIWRFVVSCLTTYIRLHAFSLRSALERVKRMTARLERAHTHTDLARVVRLVRMFRRMQPYLYSTKDRCLFNGLTLAQYLALYRIRARLIIGVRMDPFSAHCWVQFDDTVFDSTPEEVACFSPLLVI